MARVMAGHVGNGEEEEEEEKEEKVKPERVTKKVTEIGEGFLAGYSSMRAVLTDPQFVAQLEENSEDGDGGDGS